MDTGIKIKVKTKLPEFNESENIAIWLYQVYRIFEINKNTDSDKVTIASSYLRGIASKMYMNYEQIIGIPTLDKFKKYMTKMNTPFNHYKMIREQKYIFGLLKYKDLFVFVC